MGKGKIVKVGSRVSVELLLGARNECLGVGAITVSRIRVRDGRHPLLARVDTPDGYVYTQSFLEGIKTTRQGATATFRILGHPGARQEFMDEYEQPLATVNLPRTPAEDTLILSLSAVEETFGGRSWTGFSYSWEFRSAKRKIHRLMIDGSWELNGSIVGNTVLSQGQCNMPVYRGAKDTVFTTTCLKTLEQYGSPMGVSYQLAPRGGLIQAFDFQHGPKGALLQYWPDFAPISSILESPRGSTRLLVLDEYRFDLASRIRTTPQVVLLAPGALVEHEARNVWWAAWEHVYSGIRRQFGVAPTVVLPEVGLRYSTRVADTGLRMTVADREVASQEVPYAIADLVLPRLAEKGIRRFFPEVMSESDVTVLGLKRKLDAGVHGDLHCASVCATHRFLPSEFWGGLKAWRYMADKARSLGIEIGAWFAPHLSPHAAVFQEHPEYRMVCQNTLPWGGGYGINTIATADWNTGIFDWVLNDIRRWQEEGGLDYLFTDSWANLGLVESNYAAGMRNNLEPLGRLYHEFQKLGVKAFTFEGISPFGASRFGLADLRGDLMEARGGIVGQNDFGWWVGNEDMAIGLCACVAARKRNADDVARIQFRYMANRGFVMCDDQYDMMYELPDWWTRMNFVYLQALPHMKIRRLLVDDQGVCWTDGQVEVLWAYKDFAWPIPVTAALERLEGKTTTTLDHTGALQAKAGQVYRIAGASAG